MKRIALILLSLILALSLVACSKDEPQNETKDDWKESDDPTLSITECFEVPYQFDLTPYIDIQREDYVGVQIEKVEANVTDDDVNNAIFEDLEEYSTLVDVTEGGAQMGDTLNIDFCGSVDGIEFDGGTATDYQLVLGQAGFIDGFEDALVGHSTGEEFVIDVVFPENYGKDELNGKPAQFEIKMNSVKRTQLPELNEAFVKENFDCDSIEAYLAKLQEELIAEKAIEAEDQTNSLAFDAVYKNVEIKDFPKEQYDFYYNDFVSYHEEVAKTYYDMDLATYITDACGSTEDEFYYYADLNAETVVTQELIFFAIANNENLWQGLTKADYDAQLAELAELYETDTETFEAQYGSDDIWMSIIWDKAIDFVVDNAVIVDKVEEPAETTETTEE